MVSPLTLKLLRDLRGRLGSLAALVLIGALGVASFVGFDSVYRDLEVARNRFYTDYRLADFSISLKRAPEQVLSELARLEPVSAVEGRVRVSARLELTGVDEPVQATAISLPFPPRPVFNDVFLVKGAWFEDASGRQALVNDAFARAHRLRPGDRFRAVILGEQHELVLAGTVMAPEFVYVLPPAGGIVPDPSRTAVVFLPHRALQQWADLDGACNEILGRVHDPRKAPLKATLSLLEQKLDPYGVVLSIPMSEAPSVQFLENELQELQRSATILPVICLAVVAFVLHVVLGRIVASQRTFIGTVRALGYSRWQVLWHYQGYALAVGLATVALGLGLGYWIQGAMVGMYRNFYELPGLTTHPYPPVMLKAGLAGVLAPLLGTLREAWKASSLAPASAMRPPAPERGGRVFLEWLIPGIWSRFPFSIKLILRAVLRNPYRSLVTFATTFVATALMVESLCMLRAVDAMIAHEFSISSRQDVSVGLREPAGRGMLQELVSLPQVARVEPQLGVSCTLSNGPYEKRVGITGMTAEHVLYRPVDSQGVEVPLPEEGLVLSRKLAEVLHVQPGDRVRLRPLIGRRQEVQAPVAALADTYVGLAAYARIEYLSRLLGEEWVANSVLLSTYHRDPGPSLLQELNRRPYVLGAERRVRALTLLQDTIGRNLGVFFGILVLFTGGLAFGGVLNTALVSLAEREREIGTFRVLGYTKTEIMGIFAGESYLVNTLGVLFGIWGGVVFTRSVVDLYSTELFRLPELIEPHVLIRSGLLMMVFISLAMLVVYGVLARTRWLEVFKTRE